MEQFRIEQQSRSPNRSWYQVVRPNLRLFSSPADGSANGTREYPIERNNGGRLIYLRKYSMAICMVEALVITFLIYMLMKLPTGADMPASARPSIQFDNPPGLNQSCRTFHSKLDDSVKVTFLAGLVPGCNQRRHDQADSVQCRSSQIEQCRPPLSLSDRPRFKLTEKYIQVIETSRSGSRMEHSWREVSELDCDVEGALRDKWCSIGARIESLDPTRGRQKIVGWGGALSDSTINNILSLSVNGTRRLMDDYFGFDGLAFNMVRVTIGGSDFSARFYTNQDTEMEFNSVGRRRPGSSKFSLMEEDYLYKIPMLKMLLDQYNWAGRDIKLFASMWSPPVWMKTNRHFNKGQLRGSIDKQRLNRGDEMQKDNEKYFRLLAELKLNWLSHYRANNINFWGLTVMNEPIFAVQPFLQFNTMIFPRDDYANYIVKYLGPMLKSNNETRHMKLMIHDDNRRYLLNYTKPILDQPRVRQFVDGVSVHGYVDHEYDMMDVVYESYKLPGTEASRKPDDWFVLPTELCSGHLPFMEKALIGNWQRGVHYALDIIHSLQHSAAGWIDWNMALDLEGGPGWLGGRLDAPIIVDKTTDSYHKSPMFYVLGQFSRFIPAGSQRLDIRVLNQAYDNLFEVVAFLVPNADHLLRVSIVVVNDNPYEVQLLLPSRSGASNRKYYKLTVSPDSITTVKYELI